jgi:hypothetical protein
MKPVAHLIGPSELTKSIAHGLHAGRLLIVKTGHTDTFAVLNFALKRNSEGTISQRTTSCGSFTSIEQAFTVARAAATQDVEQRRRKSARQIELIDTEWGYDVREDSLVVSRYWVHDREPMALA